MKLLKTESIQFVSFELLTEQSEQKKKQKNHKIIHDFQLSLFKYVKNK